MAQPLSELTLPRPWGWGIAILSDPSADLPDVNPELPVTVGTGAIIVLVRHAQDTDATTPDGYSEWAFATLHVRILAEAEPTTRVVLSDAVIDAPNRRVSIGDAEGEVVLSGHGVRTRLIVSVVEEDVAGADEVWIDVIDVKI